MPKKRNFIMRKKKPLSIREKFLKILFPDYYQDYISLKYLIDLKNKSTIYQAKVKYKDRYIKFFEAIEKIKMLSLPSEKIKMMNGELLLKGL